MSYLKWHESLYITQLDFLSLFYPLRGGGIHPPPPLVSPLLNLVPGEEITFTKTNKYNYVPLES